MKKLHIFIIAFAALSLTGCKSLYGNYKRPKAKMMGVVRHPIDDHAQLDGTNDFGNLPWRSVFTDTLLQKIIERSLDNNPNLINAILNIDIAEQQLRAAKLAFLPNVILSPTGTISLFGSQPEPTKAYTFPIAASWNVSLFGQLRAQKKSAQVMLMQTKDYKVAAQTSLICNVANLYYTLLMLDSQKEIVENMSKLAKDTWEMMKLQIKFGRARSTSVQSAEAAYYNILTQGVTIRNNIRKAENSLSLLLGEPAHKINRGNFYYQSLPVTFSGGIGIEQLSNRADVHANEMALAQCFYNVQEARSRFYPALNISPTAAWSNGNGLISPGKLLLSIAGSLTQPIFAQGKLKAGLRVTQDQYKQAYNKWQNSILTAGAEVSNALVGYSSANEKTKLIQRQINVLKKNVEQTQLLYKQSSSSYIEVITAQQGLLNAQIAQVQEQFAKLQAIVNLYYALGGGAK